MLCSTKRCPWRSCSVNLFSAQDKLCGQHVVTSDIRMNRNSPSRDRSCACPFVDEVRFWSCCNKTAFSVKFLERESESKRGNCAASTCRGMDQLNRICVQIACRLDASLAIVLPDLLFFQKAIAETKHTKESQWEYFWPPPKTGRQSARGPNKSDTLETCIFGSRTL